MAMLAERKSKVKWTLNPRGKFWQNDENKFGQKLMEKMGWSKGKGLGKNQQGDLDPVRVAYKQDAKGFGFKWSNDDWIAHKEDFNAILANLNVVTDGQVAVPKPADTAPISLEQKSKSSKSRVHYHKFTRGKDMSRYSADDLNCILGERAKKTAKPEDSLVEVKIEEVKTEETGAEGEETSSHGVTTIKRGNLHDYFAQKLAKFKGQRMSPKGDDSDDDRPGFGFGAGLGYQPGESLDADRPMGLGFETEQMVGLGFKAEGHGFQPETGHAEKKNIFVDLLNHFETDTTRKRKRRMEEIENATNEILEKSKKTNKELNGKPSVHFDDQVKVKYISDSSFEEQPKKKKAKREKENEDQATPVGEIVIKADVHMNGEVSGKKKKKKKEGKEMVDSLPVDTAEVGEDECETANGKKKKKKNKKDKKERCEEEVMEEYVMAEVEEVIKKKKKKSKTNKNEETEDLPVETSEVVGEIDSVKVKKSKKKKSKPRDTEELCEQLEVNCEASSENTEVVKKEKKTKRRDQESLEVEIETASLLSSSGESSKKKRKRDNDSNGEVQADTVPIAVLKPQGPPQFEYVRHEVRPEKVVAMQGLYARAMFDQFTGSNLLEIKGYGQ